MKTTAKTNRRNPVHASEAKAAAAGKDAPDVENAAQGQAARDATVTERLRRERAIASHRKVHPERTADNILKEERHRERGIPFDEPLSSPALPERETPAREVSSPAVQMPKGEAAHEVFRVRAKITAVELTLQVLCRQLARRSAEYPKVEAAEAAWRAQPSQGLAKWNAERPMRERAGVEHQALLFRLAKQVLSQERERRGRLENARGPGCIRYTDERAAALVAKADSDPLAWEAACARAGHTLEQGDMLPPELNKFVVDILLNRTTKPMRRGPKKGTHTVRDAAIRSTARLLEEHFGFSPLTRNDSSGPDSICDALTAALKKLGEEIGYKAVVKIVTNGYTHRQKINNPLGGLTKNQFAVYEAIKAGAKSNDDIARDVGKRKQDVCRIVRALKSRGLPLPGT